jgi:hypothetical protein
MTTTTGAFSRRSGYTSQARTLSVALVFTITHSPCRLDAASRSCALAALGAPAVFCAEPSCRLPAHAQSAIKPAAIHRPSIRHPPRSLVRGYDARFHPGQQIVASGAI